MKSTSFFQSVLVIAATLLLLWAALGCNQKPNQTTKDAPFDISNGKT